MPDVVLQCSQVTKVYAQGNSELRVLNNVNFSIFKQETVAIIGPSGAGKSTLLNVLGGLDGCSSGFVEMLGERLDKLSENKLSVLRNQSMGFVYQFHHLLTEFDALENVAMPQLIAGINKKVAYEAAKNMLDKVGLLERQHHRPSELSGGERQRVAIARALVNEPSCVLMDEPTGNLDEYTAKQVQGLLAELNAELSISFIIVTHDMSVANEQSRIFSLHDGQLTEREK